MGKYDWQYVHETRASRLYNTNYMKEFLPQIHAFLKENKKLVIATVIKTWGSAPRQPGACMIISDAGDIVGSVSGGCVEGAVWKKAQEVFANGKSQYLKFGVSDDEAWAVGLSCGGSIEVFVEMFLAHTSPHIWKVLENDLQNDKTVVLMTALDTHAPRHLLIEVPKKNRTDDNKNGARAINAIESPRQRKNEVFENDGILWWTQVFPKKSQLIIIGAAHITVDLVQLANSFDFETIVIDPRGIFSEKTNFPTPPDQLFSDWPDEVLPNFDLDNHTYAVLLTHDPKIDDQALHRLLKSEVAYIGALGSKKTHEKRIQRLLAAGFSENQIQKIHAPIGVDIQAKSAKEIALSIIAELIKIKNG